MEESQILNIWELRNMEGLLFLFITKYSEHVIPGNIIVRQRGTKYHPGRLIECFVSNQVKELVVEETIHCML